MRRRIFRCLLFVSSCMAVAIMANAAPAADDKAKPAAKALISPKVGVRVPGIQIPFEGVKTELEIAVSTPGNITIGESVFVPSASKDEVVRIETKPSDAKTVADAPTSAASKTTGPITGVSKPCSGTLVAFDTLWVPNCGNQTVTRHDIKTNKLVATLPIGAADVSMALAATGDSVWMLTDRKSTLSRIDPIENMVVGELRLPASCNSVAFGETALWVSCPAEGKVLRIDPSANLVVKRIEVAPGPRALAFGAGSVWVLCDKEGTIERIDPKTNKVIKTLELGVPNAGGNIAYGSGFLWATQTGFPLTRIDTTAEKERVAQQFWGEGGGSIAVASGAIWLTNPTKGTVLKLDPKRVLSTLSN